MDYPTHAALSTNHRLVYDVIRESGLGRHLSVREIFARTIVRRPGTGFSTVYRAVSRLRDLGLIAEIVVPGSDSATYEPIGDAHAHFRCRRCERVADVAFAIPGETLAALSAATGFLIETGAATFAGYCEACASADRPRLAPT